MAEAEAKTKKFTRTVKPVNVEILSTHKNADDLLTILDSGGLPHGSFYKRIALS
jgi:hypothetical protein